MWFTAEQASGQQYSGWVGGVALCASLHCITIKLFLK